MMQYYYNYVIIFGPINRMKSFSACHTTEVMDSGNTLKCKSKKSTHAANCYLEG